jgi:dolichol-phosphate mannosyltransferase
MISVVLPIYNEEKGLSSFIDDLYIQMKSIGQSFEIILVNDGSTDKSLQLIQSLCTNYAELKFIGLSRNFGHQIAISAGIDYASGDQVILMDSDGQDPPEVIPDLIHKMDEGYDVVYAKRIKKS